MKPLFFSILFALCFSMAHTLSAKEADQSQIPGEMAAYMAKPEPDFRWEVVSRDTIGTVQLIQLQFTSQTWQGTKWEHDLIIFRPLGFPTDKVVVFNEGGTVSKDHLPLGALLATQIKAPVAFVLGVPKQPLYNGLREDDLIAETFVRYLETGDSNWPLLFPMVKSVVKGMDSIQDFASDGWPQIPEKFIVGGASKRGWTTWLTAAVDDRVMAITPMVIDILNMQPQLKHQIESFCRPSEQIDPYTKRDLVPLPDTEDARRLWHMIDPWAYRSLYTMPKLIVLGNNDRYWTTDALNLYWDDLPGKKYISYTPNAGHGLEEKDADGKSLGRNRTIANISAFIRYQITGQEPPQIQWQHSDLGENLLQLKITCDQQPQQARLWVAKSATKDFRESLWEPQTIDLGETPENIIAQLPRPSEGFVAYYADLSYQIEDITYYLCSQLRIAGTTGQPSDN